VQAADKLLAPCPICGRDVDWRTGEHGIFCSEECAEIFMLEFAVLVDSLDTELPADENQEN